MEKYEVVAPIAKGNFGKISKIIRKSDRKVLVWKELDYDLMSDKEKEQIVTEVNILRELKHPNIIRYYDRIIDKKESKIYIIMEYCEGGDINQLIKRYKKSNEHIPEDIIWKIFTQVLLAIHAIHNHKEGKILHRDIKPSNIFLDKDNNIKLGDFGLSRELSVESKFAYSHVGTPYYMSPEQIDETKYNEKSDIWSLGCFLYELAALKPPFQARNQIQLAMRIKEGKVEKINKRYSEELWRVIIWMLNTNYEKRPSAEELLSIPEVSVRIREKKIKENYNIIKILEDKLNLKEKELSEREEELNKRERRIIEMENKNNLKESELNEKEQKLIEFEKKLKMSSSTGYSSSKLKSSGSSEVNITLSPNRINGNCTDNINDLQNNIILPNSFNNELSNLLVYTNNNTKNQDLNIINDKLLFPNAHKLSKTNNIITSLESRMKKINSKYKNNNHLNEDAKFIHDENEYKKISKLIQSKSLINCLSKKVKSSTKINSENINIKDNVSLNLEKSSSNLKTKNNVNSDFNKEEIRVFSPLFTKNINTFSSDENINFKTYLKNNQNNNSINSNLIPDNISNLINYSTLLSNMNAMKSKYPTSSGLTKNNVSSNVYSLMKGNADTSSIQNKKKIKINNGSLIFMKKNNKNSNIYDKKALYSQGREINIKQKKNKIDGINTKRNNLKNDKIKENVKRSCTPRMNKIQTKLSYNDNVTLSNYINSSLNNRMTTGDISINQYYTNYIKNHSKNNENENNKNDSYGGLLSNVKRPYQIMKESLSVKNFINIKKSNKKNISCRVRCHSSANILKSKD